ncbi:MAG TPA: hypothetical protein VLA49_01335 [Anaerolineales bacterium]|nr:hypothetical protein [Anaerolineales bacterium]
MVKALVYLHPKYVLSLPERLVRALAASLGGLLYETTNLALPRWVRRSRLYQALVYRLLRLTVELVGDVEGVFPLEEVGVNELVVRKAVGNVIELASFVAVGWSPLWVLAAASDLTGGTRAFLNAFILELKKEGLLQDSAEIKTVDGLLNALERSSGMAADMVDVPPLKIEELKVSWLAIRQNAAHLPNADQITRIYTTFQQIATQEGRSLGALSSMIATGALRAGIHMGSDHIFDYYQQALSTINAEGWGQYLLRITRPYFVTARGHFDPRRVTNTERAILRFLGRSELIGK